MNIQIAVALAAMAALPAGPSHAEAQATAPSSAEAVNKNVLVVPTVPPLTAAAPKERIICRRDVEIGSLVKGVRRCGTASQWRESERAARETTDRIQSDKGRYCAPGQGSC